MAEIIKLKPQQNSSPGLNKLKWGLWFLVFIFCLIGNYHFVNLASGVRALCWLAVALVLFGLFIWTTQGKAFLNFAKAARNEMRKVVWPTRHETMQSTIAVLIMVAILAFLLWIIDSLWFWLITLITG